MHRHKTLQKHFISVRRKRKKSWEQGSAYSSVLRTNYSIVKDKLCVTFKVKNLHMEIEGLLFLRKIMRHIQGEKFTYGDRRIIISKKKQKIVVYWNKTSNDCKAFYLGMTATAHSKQRSILL